MVGNTRMVLSAGKYNTFRKRGKVEATRLVIGQKYNSFVLIARESYLDRRELHPSH